MADLKTILHANASPNDIEKIIQIKSLSWPYTLQEHQQWIKEHLKDADIHVMLYDGDNCVAYLNFISIEITLNGILSSSYGVGNVCSIEKGRGYGSLLMEASNNFLISRNELGLLFCKPSLLKFYKKSGWEQIPNTKVKLNFDNSYTETMLFNHSEAVQQLIFEGEAF